MCRVPGAALGTYLTMLKKLLPKERLFFDLFDQQAAAISRGLKLFETLIHDYARLGELNVAIKAVEDESDGIAHNIYNLLNNSFMTPFDREDIRMLVHRMDDVMDLTEKACARMQLYDMTEPPVNVDQMLVIIQKAFDKISQAVAMLNQQKNYRAIMQLCVEVNSLENEGDALLRKSLARLFKEATDPFYLIKAKEIYESLEEATDRCEDLANILETILVKNA
jgi:predicted phosphate transport protein (TIGR00153 family)